MYFRKQGVHLFTRHPETGYDIGGYGGSSRKDARERNNERLAQKCTRREQWKARAKMREKWMMNGSRKDAREMDDERLAQKCARTEQWKGQKKPA